MESDQQIYRGDSGDSNDSSVGDIPIELPHLEAQYIYIKTVCSKGQLISKANFKVFIWTKNDPKNLKDFCPMYYKNSQGRNPF